MGFGRYILKDHEPVKCDDLMIWAVWLEDSDRQVAESFFQHGVTGEILRVSTVFLGLDHNYAPHGPPLLFETMAFGAPEEMGLFGRILLHARDLGIQLRYSTWDEAVAGHRVICDDVRETLARTEAETEASIKKAQETSQ